MPRTAICLALVVSAFAGAASADELQLYVNGRFGASALVPKAWASLPPPENGDGLVFVSPDQRARITVSGSFNLGQSENGVVQPLLPVEGARMTYSRQGPGWAVSSGVKDATIFYRKVMVSCKGQIANDLIIEYPAAEKAAYDGLVGRIAASMRGGCGIY